MTSDEKPYQITAGLIHAPAQKRHYIEPIVAFDSIKNTVEGSQVNDMASADHRGGDPLDVLAYLAQTVANERITWTDTDFTLTLPEFRMLERARTILMLNARHVPMVIDEVLEKARQHGGLKS